jgi:hypothetical protein
MSDRIELNRRHVLGAGTAMIASFDKPCAGRAG